MQLNPEYQNGVNEQIATLQDPPAFQVTETLLEQGSGRVNEDIIYADDTRCIVCDGATSLGSDDGNAASGGWRAAAITAEAFTQHRDLLESARSANETIREQMIESRVDFTKRELLWSTSFAAVTCSGETLEWCQIGDCVILVIFDDGSSRRLTDVPAQDAEVLKAWQRIGADSTTTIYRELADEIGSVRRRMNRDFGVLNGEDEALPFISHGSMETDRVSDILLFSDGLFPPSSDPDYPFAEEIFVALYQQGGLRKVRDYIRAVQQEDPRCYRYPRFKRFDDISAIALKRV